MKTDLAMVIHFHQPVGNFDNVIEGACNRCYLPFLETLKKYPKIKMTFHFTGCLLEWMEEKRPEILDIIKEMSSSGQVEIISGGFYEPILPTIPRRDRISQITMLNNYIKDKFSSEPKGAWIAERVWEPALPSVLFESGIKYTVLDDTHFLYAGIKKDDTYGYYTTEDNGKVVAVFPSDKVLRYHIPYKMPKECIEYIRSTKDRIQDAVFIYGDDGEKFGEWPGTHKWVFEEKWLEKFLNELKKNSDWLDTVTLAECYEKRKSKGQIYLPAVSYEEMLEWALPAEIGEQMEDVILDIRNAGKEDWYKPFIRGGFWRNFLTKYPESNNMNKKMVYVSEKLEKIRRAGKAESKEFAEAEKELFRGQCNCAYWHGVFGGLYLFHLRRAIYEHLIRGEVYADKIVHGENDFLEHNVLDIDADGFDEIILANKKISLYFDPEEGGTLKELDSKLAATNLINSLSRRKETYHRKIIEKVECASDSKENGVKTIHDGIQTPEQGIREHLNYDWYNRSSFVDHFFDKGTDIGAFQKCMYEESGDFVLGGYDHKIEEGPEKTVLIMKRDGMVRGKDISIEKKITLGKKEEGFSVSYIIENKSDDDITSVFAPEINLTMTDADSERYEVMINDKGSSKGLKDDLSAREVNRVEVLDHEKVMSFRVDVDKKCELWMFPVKTVSQSEKAYELNYQSTAIIPMVYLAVAPGEIFELELKVAVLTS